MKFQYNWWIISYVLHGAISHEITSVAGKSMELFSYSVHSVHSSVNIRSWFYWADYEIFFFIFTVFCYFYTSIMFKVPLVFLFVVLWSWLWWSVPVIPGEGYMIYICINYTLDESISSGAASSLIRKFKMNRNFNETNQQELKLRMVPSKIR